MQGGINEIAPALAARIERLESTIRQIRLLADWHYDPDADPLDVSPADNVAHVNGLVVKLCDEVLSGPA